MKYRILFMCPYFGHLAGPQYKLWLHCCEKNPSIDFLIITDDDDALRIEHPKNVQMKQMSWEECKNLVQRKLNVSVSMAYSYKMCDLRPAYGHIFDEDIVGYDFWGHIDITDTILGDLRKFITDQILEEYDKISYYGHLSLYRNTQENNARYQIPAKSGVSYKDLFQREEGTCFDDMYQSPSINDLFVENDFPLLEKVDGLVADILPFDWYFRLPGEEKRPAPRVYEWNSGVLLEHSVVGNAISTREIGYVHYQKRKVQYCIDSTSSRFYFVPNMVIEPDGDLTVEQIREYAKPRIYLDPILGRVKRIKWYAKRPRVFARKLRETLR